MEAMLQGKYSFIFLNSKAYIMFCIKIKKISFNDVSVNQNNSRRSMILNGDNPIPFCEEWQCSYRQFGGHKNRENKSLKIEINVLRVCFGLFWAFIHVRLTIQRIRIFAL